MVEVGWWRWWWRLDGGRVRTQQQETGDRSDPIRSKSTLSTTIVTIKEVPLNKDECRTLRMRKSWYIVSDNSKDVALKRFKWK